jgi:Na+/H+ antiporter NhaD/arsenite permease-like protein
VILTGILVLLCRVMFRRTFVADPERTARVMALDEGSTIRDAPLLRRCLVVLSLVVVGFFTGQVTGLEPSVVALLGAGLLVALSGLSSGTYLADVEWESLAFFAGLFVMVGALVHTGVIERVGAAATSAMGDRYLLGAGGLLFGSAALSAVVDNIPFVATMAPLVHDLAALGDGGSQAGSLWWALSLGANLGGNATAVGASANVVIIGIARRHGHPVSFWRFTRYGIVVAAVTVAVSWLYLWLRYFVL